MLGLPPAQLRMLAAVFIAVPISSWGAVYPENTWLQVGPVLLVVALLAAALRRWPMSDGSLAWFAGFLLLHLFAARWTYSSVPYDKWSVSLAGFSIDAALGFQRNMFDRLVHFAFGLCMIAPLTEIGRRYHSMSPRLALTFSLLFIWAGSAFYEVFEWLLAVIMDPAAAEAYNGQQGDMFDPQKDMLAAGLGALMGASFPTRRR